MTALSTTTEFNLVLARLAAGEAGARDLLLARTHDRLRVLAHGLLRGSFGRLGAFEQSDDVSQTASIRLLKGWDGIVKDDRGEALKDASVFLARVSRLLREVLLDLVRSHFGRSGRRRIPGRFAGPGSSSTSSDPAAFEPGTESLNPEALALMTDFHRAVEELPENLRAVVDLHWYQGFTHQDVGQFLGIAEPTSRKYWVAARLKLTEKLGTNPFDRYKA